MKAMLTTEGLIISSNILCDKHFKTYEHKMPIPNDSVGDWDVVDHYSLKCRICGESDATNA